MYKNKQQNCLKAKKKIGLTRLAGRLCIIGMIILTLGTFDVAARLYEGFMSGAVGIMLHMGYEIEALMAGGAILTGGTLLLDYMERQVNQ